MGDEERYVASDYLIGIGSSLVLLGEAGMGETALTEWLDWQDGYRQCTAKQLIRHANPAALLGNARVLVIDALDEVRAQRDGDAVDLVLTALGRLGHPQFVLSCRVADWRSATGIEAIRQDYSKPRSSCSCSCSTATKRGRSWRAAWATPIAPPPFSRISRRAASMTCSASRRP
ncbi:MAG: hypothetical protein H7Y61_15435 [Rhizobiales bacterium]|nr:hypothetical protein [Rhizobacter sp.]